MCPKSPSRNGVMFQLQSLERHSRNEIWYTKNSNPLNYVVTWLKLLLCCHNREGLGVWGVIVSMEAKERGDKKTKECVHMALTLSKERGH